MGAPRIYRHKRTQLQNACHDYAMQKNVEVGAAGSLTIAVLIIAVVFLMRSFYKRYMGIDRSDDSSEQ